MSSGLDCRFKAGGDYQARNPHMRGTANVLRLLFGIPLGADHNSEFMMIEGERIHIFDAFALVNYLLCSAVSADGRMRGLAARTTEYLRIICPAAEARGRAEYSGKKPKGCSGHSGGLVALESIPGTHTTLRK